jgi:hypothetical protein
VTRIIIHDIDGYYDLLKALAKVADVFSDPDTFASPNVTFYRDTPDPADRGVADVQPGRAVASPYLQCPRRGQHLRLLECAHCWADVLQGYAIETDVLHPDAWDAGLRAIE